MVRDRRAHRARRASGRDRTRRARLCCPLVAEVIDRCVSWAGWLPRWASSGSSFGNGLASVVWVVKLNVQARVRDLVAVPDGGPGHRDDAHGDRRVRRHDHDRTDRGRAGRRGPAGRRRRGDPAAAAELAAAIDAFVSGPYAELPRALPSDCGSGPSPSATRSSRLSTSVPIDRHAAGPRRAARRPSMPGWSRSMRSVSYLSQLGAAGVVDARVLPQASPNGPRAPRRRSRNVSALVGDIDGVARRRPAVDSTTGATLHPVAQRRARSSRRSPVCCSRASTCCCSSRAVAGAAVARRRGAGLTPRPRRERPDGARRGSASAGTVPADLPQPAAPGGPTRSVIRSQAPM